MKRDVVLLEYTDYTKDTIVLGVFSSSKLNDTINFYKTLDGFSNNKGNFIHEHHLPVDGSSVYLLQICDTCEDFVIFEDIYETKEKAQFYLENFINSKKDQNYNSYIEKYYIDERLWSEGFVTLR